MPNSDKLLQVLLVEDNPGDAVLVQELLFDADGDPFTLERAESLLDGLDKLARINADVILLDLSLPDSYGMETFTTMKAHASGTPIVLLTGNDNETMALAAMEAGAQDYLVKDKLTSDVLARSLRYAVLRHQRHPEAAALEIAKSGKVIGILGASGGAGATTLACHLAADLKRQTGAPILLADLDTNGGAVAFLMKVHSPFSIVDASENLSRLDFAFWKSMVSTTPDGVDVISWTGSVVDGYETKVGRILHTLRFVKQHYSWIVLDLGRLGPFSAGLVKEADELLLVTTADIVSLYQLTRLVESLANCGVDRKALSIIHNQAAKWSGDQQMLEAVTDIPVSGVLPSCRDELNAAYTKGRLVEPSAKFRKSLLSLACNVAGVKSQESSRRTLLFGTEEPRPVPRWME